MVFNKILTGLKLVLVGLVIFLVVQTIFSHQLFWSRGLIYIPRKGKAAEVNYKDEKGRIIVRVWGFRSDPDVSKENAISPVRAWRQGHKIRLINMELIQRFEKKYPHINVVVEQGRGKDSYDPRVFVTLMGSGKGPCTLGVWGSSVGTLASKGFIACLDKYVKGWDRYDDYWPIFWEPQMYAGHYYAIPNPYVNCVTGLIYRKDLLIEAGFVDEKGEAKPPRTWKEMAYYAQKLRDEEKQIYGLGFDGTSEAGGWNLIHYFWQAGSNVVEKKGNRWQAVFNNEAGVKALQFVKDLKWKYNAIQPDIMMGTWDALRIEFRNGKIAMFKAYDDDYFRIIRMLQVNPDDIGFCALPAGPAGSATDVGGYGWVINSQLPQEQKDATWQFLSFLCSEEEMIYWLKRLDELNSPVLETGTAFRTLDVKKYVSNIIPVPGVRKIIESARVEPYCDGFDRVKIALSDVCQEVLLDKNANCKKILDKYARYFNKYYLKEEKIEK
jgi:ABC-type glycerol-3-phosphate transport system substrate-binding protein